MKCRRLIALVAVLVVTALHNDWWNREPRPEALFGVIPRDIAYHLLWLAAASVALWLVVRAAWPSRDARGTPEE